MRIELDRQELINVIESVFKNTERIHGKSEAIDWIKVASHKVVTYLERMDNTFSGQPTPDLCCGVYEERPLELKICTRCSKEFKSNIDCPVCPSCYL